METINIDTPKSQVDMLAKRGDFIVDQWGNSYSMNAMKLSKHKSRENSNYVSSENNFNGETKTLCLLDTI